MRRSPGMKFIYRFILFFAWAFFKIFYRHRVYGLEHYYEDAAIIAGNHTSFYDPPILAISWPQEVNFLARDTLFSSFLFGKLIRALNSHPIKGDASDIGVFKAVGKLLSEGKKVILFPEGTRSTNGELGEIKQGVGFLVSRTQSAIIPAYIHGAYEVYGRNRSFPKLWGKTACVFGTPIKWESFQHLEKREAMSEISNKLSDSIKALKTWYDSGANGIPP